MYLKQVDSYDHEFIKSELEDSILSFEHADYIWLINKLWWFGTTSQVKQIFVVDLITLELEHIKTESPDYTHKSIQSFENDGAYELLITGGTNSDMSEMTDKVFIFDPVNKKMREGASLTFARSHHCQVQFHNTVIYAFGGLHNTDRLQPWTQIERITLLDLFNTAKKWTPIQYTSKVSLVCIDAVAINFPSRILIFGGQKDSLWSNLRTGYAYSPKDFTLWTNMTKSQKEVILNHSWKMLCASVKVFMNSQHKEEQTE